MLPSIQMLYPWRNLKMCCFIFYDQRSGLTQWKPSHNYNIVMLSLGLIFASFFFIFVFCFAWLTTCLPFLQLGHGDFSAASTKVLRMVNTLAVDNEAKQTIQALQTELQKTKDRLQAVEELNNQSGTNSLLRKPSCWKHMLISVDSNYESRPGTGFIWFW